MKWKRSVSLRSQANLPVPALHTDLVLEFSRTRNKILVAYTLDWRRPTKSRIILLILFILLISDVFAVSNFYVTARGFRVELMDIAGGVVRAESSAANSKMLCLHASTSTWFLQSEVSIIRWLIPWMSARLEDVRINLSNSSDYRGPGFRSRASKLTSKGRISRLVVVLIKTLVSVDDLSMWVIVILEGSQAIWWALFSNKAGRKTLQGCLETGSFYHLPLRGLTGRSRFALDESTGQSLLILIK